MRILEFGDKQKAKIILIHGLNIPWQMWVEEITIYSKEYHVIVPVLSGHDIEQNLPFISITEEAEQVKKFVIEKYGKSVYMIIGMSMGAAIALSAVSDGNLQTEYLVFDSGVFVSTNPLLLQINNKMELSYINKTKARNAKTLKQLNIVYGEKLAPYYIAMVDDAMTTENFLAAAHSIGTFTFPKQLKLPNTKIIAFHGTVLMEIQAKKSAKYLKQYFPQAYIKVFQGNQHGELSVNQPKKFVEEIEKAMRMF
jgi:hypothetical protein